MSRRRAPLLAVVSTVAALAAVPASSQAPGPRGASELARVDAALEAAAGYLVERQAEDGAWRSEVYGSFRDGTSLTPHVLSTLLFIAATPQARRSVERGAEYLAGLDPSSATPAFPVYTAAAGSWIAGLRGDGQARQAWLDFLLARQMVAGLGWEHAHAEFGGWGDGLAIPRRGRGPLPSAAAPNLSATVYALGALRSAGVPSDDPRIAAALRFVERCQNHAPHPRGEAGFDDGGFHFAPADAARNKAGPAGRDATGRERYASYGSMTADGLRALLACGLPPDHPRVLAARRWLEHRFRADANPGAFHADREVLRDATYYYWCWSVAHAFRRLGVHRIETDRGTVAWPAALAEELIRRQRPDGSWSNGFTDSKEDDPLVATPFAAAALALARRTLAEHAHR